MMIIPSEFFRPEDAHQQIADEQKPDENSENVGHD
jgi:hypothetical protein